ncbi:phosphatase PAP2 family protein [uncultured Flavobacterium sp.]|uniref:phosphatase PAP2 family protein n=1 Tax=uncultured Flavobacterium sp. TaxID=165435 RepID=UPI0030ED92F2
MDKLKTLFQMFFLLFVCQISAQQSDTTSVEIQKFKINDEVTYGYKKPTTWQMFKYIPDDLYQLGKFTIQKENLKYDALVLGSTLALLPYDQKILDDAGAFGKKVGGWDEDAQYHKVVGVLRIIPKNIPSAVYYVGNGGTTMLLSGMFYAIGKIGKDDYRALNTSSELIEVLFSVGVTTQTLKRITGRQSPSAAIRDENDGGDWKPFPSFNAFQKNTPNYDAMPSGHLATYIATVTVIGTNYPEIKWIKPIGYTLGGVLAFNMVSGKVHWTSDYPIAVLIGYVMGKTVANRRIIKEVNKNNLEKKTTYKFDYSFKKTNQFSVVGVAMTF